MFWPPPHVPVYPWHWSGIEVAGFDVFKPLYADGVDEKEGALTHMMTLVEELAVCNSSLCRYIAVMTLE